MQCNILIVEDSNDSREFLKILLELSNYEVTEAKNGEEAIKSIKRTLPDLILMDINMPVMNGFTAGKIIKEIKGLDKVPIIAVTGCETFYRHDAINAGFDDLISKPVCFNKLKIVLENYLTIH